MSIFFTNRFTNRLRQAHKKQINRTQKVNRESKLYKTITILVFLNDNGRLFLHKRTIEDI